MYTQLQEVRRNFSRRELQVIHEQAVTAVENLQSMEKSVVCALQEVEEKLVYRFLGYGSLFSYATQALFLSESQAYSYIAVARTGRKLAAFQAAVESGEIPISKAARITSVIEEGNERKWIELAKTLSKRELEKEIVNVHPRASVPEKTTYIDATTLALQTSISEENLQLLRHAQDLLAQKTGRSVNLEQTLAELARFYIEKSDPLQKARRAEARREKREGKTNHNSDREQNFTEPRNQNSESLCPGKKIDESFGKRRPLKASIKHAVFLRDKGLLSA